MATPVSHSFDADHAESEQIVPEKLTGFLGEPMPFSKCKHGESLQFSADYSVVESQESKHGGVAYTEHPIPVNNAWRLTLIPTSGYERKEKGEIVSSSLTSVSMQIANAIVIAFLQPMNIGSNHTYTSIHLYTLYR